MIRSILVLIFSAILSTSVVLSTASAATSDWIDSSKLKSYMTSLKKKGLLPTKIKCERDHLRSTYNKNYYKVQITSKPQSKPHKDWKWVMANDIKNFDIQMTIQGYKRVNRSYVAKYGTTFTKCALYHKRNS